MSRDPKPTRGMPRSLLYALIPVGFLLLVIIFVWSGNGEQETGGEVPPAVEQPTGTQEPGPQEPEAEDPAENQQ